jgi:hypothetical protein
LILSADAVATRPTLFGYGSTPASANRRNGGRVPACHRWRLLLGEELTDSESWLLTSPKSAPDPTELQRACVEASRAFETGSINDFSR